MFIFDVIRMASREIRRNFFKAGYKIGATVGALGGHELAQGFSSGLRKMAEAAVEKATNESDLHELIETELARLVDDALRDSDVTYPLGDIGADAAAADHPVSPEEREDWEQEALEEIQGVAIDAADAIDGTTG